MVLLVSINHRLFVAVLEVYQFARDAAVAEAWLIAQEPYLMSTELGVSFTSYLLIRVKMRSYMICFYSTQSTKWNSSLRSTKRSRNQLRRKKRGLALSEDLLQ